MNIKTLYVVRHAKSDWNNPKLTDFERPLNKRGFQNAPLMGRQLQKKGMKPDLILSSPALRAITTGYILADALEYPRETIALNRDMYEASRSTLLRIASQQSDKVDSLMLIGHNPGLTDFVNQLSDFHTDNMPTCSIVCIDFEIDSWKEIKKQKGTLRFFEYPKKYS